MVNKDVHALALALLVGCGATGPRQLSVGSNPGAEGDDVRTLNARARGGAVTDTLHGVEVSDPYRALEEESELTRAWVDAQTARTTALLSAHRAPQAEARLDALLSIGVVGSPHVAGDRIFYTKREGVREQPAVFVHEGGTLRAEPLIDPLRYGERAALDWYFPSPAGRYVAFGVSSDGDERSTLRVIDVESGTVLDDVIEHAKWSTVTWLHSEDGFYYRRYPKEGEAGWDPEAQDTYHVRLFFHRLGTDPAEDVLVFSPGERTDFPTATVSEDDRWLIVSNFRGWSAADLYLLDRGANGERSAPEGEEGLIEVAVGEPHIYSGQIQGERLYITHNDDAPRYRVDSVSLSRASDRSAWEAVIPESEGTLEDVLVLRDQIIVHGLENIESRLRVYGLDGQSVGEIALPGTGEIFGLDGDPSSGRVAFGFSSFVHPPALFTWSASMATPSELDRVETDIDFSGLEVSRGRARSADGTDINVFYVHRRDLPRDRSARVVLNAYGGFNISLLPGFQRNALYWVERGGVYAVANLRGGGEFGEAWHQAGNRANKERVFEDMEAAIQWLGGESGISRPDRIAITGGSNGGLLMGAMITRCPQRFGATVAGVGLYDMVRYHHFPPAELWISEYGSADESAEQLGWLHAYSPYHRVVDRQTMPSVLITTADHDTRVHWSHSTKFTARLQEATGEADPNVYFYMVRSVGHGAGTRLSDTVQRYVRQYTFIEQAIGSPEMQ